MYRRDEDSYAMRVAEVTGHRSLERYCGLPRVDHEDTWRVSMDGWPDHPAGRCAHMILEEAAPATREGLRRGWSSIGLKLDDGADAILGWTISHDERDLLVLALPSRVGMPAELIFRRDGHDVLFATLVEARSAPARLLWHSILPVHTRIVRALLTDACTRLASTGGPDTSQARRR
jgi:hypothetical protein